MKSKESLSKAIKQVLFSYSNIIPQKIDMDLMVNNCKKEFSKLDLPFYSIEQDKQNENLILIDTPFMKDCIIKIEPYELGSIYKAAILIIDNKEVRKVKLQSLSTEYIKATVEALIDYLKRYLLLKNKFNE